MSRARKETKALFNSLKDEFAKVSDWILHLHSKSKDHERFLSNIDDRFSDFEDRLNSVENELEEVKNFITFFGSKLDSRLFKCEQTARIEQTPVQTVPTSVRTSIQAALTGKLTVMERAVLWVLLNTDLKLSCEDIAAVLGKNKSTVRGQINNIKAKSEGLISEIIESTGKKRYYVSEKVKESLLAKIKRATKNKKKVKSET